MRSAATVAGKLAGQQRRSGPRSRMARTPAEWRSRWSSSSRTSAQVKSSCCSARFAGQPVVAEVVAVVEHPPPQVVDADVVERGAGDDRRRPLVLRPHHAQRAGQVARRGACLLLAVAVGLVDRDHVGDLEDALLDALQLVAGAGQGEEEERVDHAGDGHLRLADADRLDQHHVVAGGLEHGHRLHGGAGDAAERARRRAGPDVGVRGRPTASPSGSCRRAPSRRCGRWTGRPRARRPGGPPRSAGCRAPR